MIHELDEAIRQMAKLRPPLSGRHLLRPLDPAAPPRSDGNEHGEASGTLPGIGPGPVVRSTLPRHDGVRLSLCPGGRPLAGSTLRVIETTWRLWRGI